MERDSKIPNQRRRLTRRFAWAAAALLLTSGELQAQSTEDWGVGSTNLDQLTHFWAAVERSNAPVTVLAFGDSMSLQYQSIQNTLFNRLQASHGSAGYAFLDTYNRIGAYFGGGAAWLDPKTTVAPLWWTDQIQLPPDSYVSWADSWYGLGPVVCDQVGVFWIAHPGGGAFTLSIATNRNVWSAPVMVLDGYSPQPVGRYTNTTLAQASYWLRADGLSGTNLILSPQLLNRASTGIRTAYLAKGGANLNEFFSLSTNITYPILAALDPQLVVWHMKELGDIGEIGLSNRLFDIEAVWKTCLTNGDVIYLGTPYDVRDDSRFYTPVENRLLKQAAERDGRGYLDCMSPCLSYQCMVSKGYMADIIHINNSGNAYLVNLAWPALTWSALRTDRRLTLQPAADGAQTISWLTATNLTYELQAATDLRRWSPVHTVQGDGARHAFTDTPTTDGSRLFRLKLTGN